MSLLARRRMMMNVEDEEDMKYFEIIDDISIEEEVEEIPLAVDFMDAKEVFVMASIPANGLDGTKYYFLSTNNEDMSKCVGWLSSYSNNMTGSEVHYIALERGKGRFTSATGMQGANIDLPGNGGGSASINVLKWPRTVGNVPKLTAWNGFKFPIGTRIIAYRR